MRLLALGAAAGLAMGAMSVELQPCPAAPRCVSSRAEPEDARHYIEPFLLRPSRDESWRALQEIVVGLPRTEVLRRAESSLHVEVRTRLLRFRDDLELVRAADGARVDVRSASRVGYWDLGANRARVEALRGALRSAGVIE